MKAPALLAASYGPSTGTWFGLLEIVAIICVVAWAIIACVKAVGITVHPILRIIFIALVSIAAIILMFRAFAMLLGGM